MRIGFIGTGAMAQAIARGAVASGVDPATLVFSNRTPAKACDLAERENGTIPAQLIDRVTSPGGTTIAGLLAAEEGGLSTALVGAVDASIHADSHLG